MKEQYTKVSHEEIVRLHPETREEITIVDAADQFRKAHRWEFITLKLKYIFPIFFLLLSLPISYIFVYLRATIPDDDVTQALGVLDTLSYISRSGPILDIKPITGGQVCDDLNYEPVSLGYWGGTIPGCYCSETDDFKPRYCFWWDKTTCSNVTERYDMDSHTWNGDRFCVLRSKKYIRTVGSCPSGYQKCGNFICVDSAGPCPVSDVQILDAATATPAGYTARPLTRSQKLVFINDATSDNQFVQFNQSTNDPCLDATSSDKRINSLSHALERQIHLGCGKYGVNTETSKLNTVIEQDYFTSNFVYEKVKDIPHFLAAISGSNVSLSAMYRFATKQNAFCANIALDEVKGILTELDDFARLYLGVAVGAALLSTIMGWVGIVYIRVLYKQGLWITDKEEPFGRSFVNLNQLVLTVFYIITAILGVIYSNTFKDRKSYILDLNDNSCFTQTNINLAVSDFSDYIKKKTNSFVELNLLMTVIGIGIALAMGLNIIIRRAKKWEKYY